MSILHSMEVLKKRRDSAIKAYRSSFYNRLSYILLGLFVGSIVGVSVFMLIPDENEKMTQVNYVQAVSKAQKKGVLIKNVSYNLVDTQTSIRAKETMQFDNAIKLKKVSIGVAKVGVVNADKAQVESKKNIVKLQGNIEYIQQDGVTINSESIVYDHKKQIMSSKGDMKVVKENMIVHGIGVQYDMQKKILNVKEGVTVEIK